MELLPPVPTQTEVIPAHACQGLKWLTEVVLVSCKQIYVYQDSTLTIQQKIIIKFFFLQTPMNVMTTMEIV